jgi:hypothetical protein
MSLKHELDSKQKVEKPYRYLVCVTLMAQWEMRKWRNKTTLKARCLIQNAHLEKIQMPNFRPKNHTLKGHF